MVTLAIIQVKIEQILRVTLSDHKNDTYGNTSNINNHRPNNKDNNDKDNNIVAPSHTVFLYF